MKKDNKILSISLILIGYIALLVLMIHIESQSEESNIKTLGDGVWYAIVTLTTVGYGDHYPVTPLGKFLSLSLLVGSVGLITFFISTLTNTYAIYSESKKMGHKGTSFENHIVIIGWDRFAQSVAKQLTRAGNKVAIVTDKKDDIDLIYDSFGNNEAFALFSDLNNTTTLENAGLDSAKVAFINLTNDTEKLILVINLKKLHPHLDFVVTLDNPELRETFKSAGVTFMISNSEVSSKMLASYIFEPDVANFCEDLLASATTRHDYDIQQYKVVEGNSYISRCYGDAFTEMKAKYNAVLMGLVKTINGERQILKLPPDDTVIDEHDYVILVTNGDSTAKISQDFKVKEGILSC